MRNIMFKDTETDTELVLPVTPSSFEVSHGINIETVNIHTLGDVILPGYGTLPTFKISLMLPAKSYSFTQSGALMAPYAYIEKFEGWCDKHTPLQLIVSGTTVNKPVLMTDFTYGEKDGTGDVYATVNLREYRKLTAVQTEPTGNQARPGGEKVNSVVQHIIKAGETLWSICRSYYGDPTLYGKLAAYNKIPNANLIIAGKTLVIPSKSVL